MYVDAQMVATPLSLAVHMHWEAVPPQASSFVHEHAPETTRYVSPDPLPQVEIV
jgi:hypothetical protein